MDLPQQFLDFVGLVGFHESDLVFQHHVSSLDFFELPVDKMNDVMLGLVRLFDSLILLLELFESIVGVAGFFCLVHFY